MFYFVILNNNYFIEKQTIFTKKTFKNYKCVDDASPDCCQGGVPLSGEVSWVSWEDVSASATLLSLSSSYGKAVDKMFWKCER